MEIKIECLDNKRIWTLKELAAYTDYEVSYLRRLSKEGKIRTLVPNGKYMFFLRDDVYDYLEGHHTKTDAEIKDEANKLHKTAKSNIAKSTNKK